MTFTENEHHWITSALNTPKFTIKPLANDASSRQHFRITIPSASQPDHTMILVKDSSL